MFKFLKSLWEDKPTGKPAETPGAPQAPLAPQHLEVQPLPYNEDAFFVGTVGGTQRPMEQIVGNLVGLSKKAALMQGLNIDALKSSGTYSAFGLTPAGNVMGLQWNKERSSWTLCRVPLVPTMVKALNLGPVGKDTIPTWVKLDMANEKFFQYKDGKLEPVKKVFRPVVVPEAEKLPALEIPQIVGPSDPELGAPLDIAKPPEPEPPKWPRIGGIS